MIYSFQRSILEKTLKVSLERQTSIIEHKWEGRTCQNMQLPSFAWCYVVKQAQKQKPEGLLLPSGKRSLHSLDGNPGEHQELCLPRFGETRLLMQGEFFSRLLAPALDVGASGWKVEASPEYSWVLVARANRTLYLTLLQSLRPHPGDRKATDLQWLENKHLVVDASASFAVSWTTELHMACWTVAHLTLSVLAATKSQMFCAECVPP